MIGRVLATALLVSGGSAGGGALAAEAPPAQAAAALDGVWSGGLEVGGGRALRVVLRVQGAAATFDSPDQNVSGIPGGPVAVDGARVRVPLAALQAAFEGTLSADGSTLEGVWKQGSASLPLVLKRTAAQVSAAPTAAPALERPQTPRPPFPYAEVQASWPNPAAPGATLAGTLTVPAGKGPFPAVLLLTGSGQQDRDETIFGHKPFLVLADALTRKGVAVLRVDDRGVGGSQGAPVATATTADFAEDAKASLAWLRARPEIDPKRVGLLGHSEGGIIAARAAAADPSIGFVVLMAGPTLPGDENLVEQVRALTLAAGAPAAQADASAATQARLLDALTGAADPAAGEAAAIAILTAQGLPEASAKGQLRPLLTPWYQWFLRHDPAPDLRRLRMPVLALFGEKDAQVPPAPNAAAARAALSGAKAATVEIVPGANHLFQPATTGSPSEYAAIPITIAPAALDRMVGWIVGTVGAGKR